MIEAVPEERRGGRPLVPLPGNGDGAVRAALLTDQYAEAAFVADQVAAAHAEGLPGLAGGDPIRPAWRVNTLSRARLPPNASQRRRSSDVGGSDPGKLRP